MRPAAAAVPVPRAHRPVGRGAHVAVADLVRAARLSAVRVRPVAVPLQRRPGGRAGRHTHLAVRGHAARRRRAGAHRLHARPRLTRARGPRARRLGQRDRAQPPVHGPGHQGRVGRVKTSEARVQADAANARASYAPTHVARASVRVSFALVTVVVTCKYCILITTV